MAENPAPTRPIKPVVAEAAVLKLADILGEPGELRQLRQRAWRYYNDAPLPSRVAHLWKYTDPADLLPAEIVVPSGPSAVGPVAALEDAAVAVILRPGVQPMLTVSPEAERAGVRVRPIGDAEMDHHLVGAAVSPEHGLFEALNTAMFGSSAAIYIPSGVKLDGPIHVVATAAQAANLPRLLIHAGTRSEATIIEEHAGGGEDRFVVGVSEVFVEAQAQVRHVLLERLDGGTAAHLSMRGHVRRDGNLLAVVASFGGGKTKVDLGGVLLESGARSEIVGFVLGQSRQHFDHHTLHDHRAPHTTSNIDFKVALNDRARSAYTGLIRIAKDAPGAEAYQENRNLLLSSKCRADTIPELEILTDDVRCTHGATVAPIDAEQLFYLRSRGLAEEAGRRLIVRGFLEKALVRLPASLRQRVETALEERLGAL
ncbi:MAG: Fe-S cluster assembly protein SufD [Myxococcales bacterium]|nr:MAG: Fe-S cluster assembly protein SufD [Myxococcales bacterium]